jgi:hypothetical protein
MSKFKRVAVVTLPVLKLKPNQTRYLKILGAIRVGKQIDDKKEPAHICNAVDLETYEMGIVVCPFLMRNELNAAYPGDKYVGKCFEVTVTRQPGKAYNHVTLIEVAEPEDFEQAAEAARISRRADEAANIAAVAADVGAAVTVDELGNVVPDAPANSRRRAA